MFRETHFSRRTFVLTLIGGAALVYQLGAAVLVVRVKPRSRSRRPSYHTQPFFLLLFGALLLGDRPGPEKLVWFLVAFVGLLCVIGDRHDGREASRPTTSSASPSAIGAAGALCGVATLVAKQLKGIPPHLLARDPGHARHLHPCSPSPISARRPAGARRGSTWSLLGVIHTCVMYILMYSAFQKLPNPRPIADSRLRLPGGRDHRETTPFYDQSLHLRAVPLGIALIIARASAGVNPRAGGLPNRAKGRVADAELTRHIPRDRRKKPGPERA